MTNQAPSPLETKNIPNDSAAVEQDNALKTGANEFVMGWTPQAEIWNGRLAMLGFIISITVELITGHSVLSQLVN